jgi:hypothetical protein
MNATEDKKPVALSPEDLASLGEGALGYIREIDDSDAIKLMGPMTRIAPGTKLFCLYHADGTPVSISASHEAALGSAMEHELLAVSLH